jgi:hypothetical protein
MAMLRRFIALLLVSLVWVPVSRFKKGVGLALKRPPTPPQLKTRWAILQKQTRPEGAGHSDALRCNIVRNYWKTMTKAASPAKKYGLFRALGAQTAIGGNA